MPRRSRPLSDPDHPRRRLLAAAAEAFGVNGYERTSLAQIASAAGLPKSSVLYYFPNKQALLLGISLDIHAALQAQLDALEQQALAPDEALGAAVEGHVALVIARFPATRTLLHALPADLAGREQIMAARGRYRARLQAIVQRGIAAGVFAPVEPWLATEALLGLFAYSLAERYDPAWPLDPAAIAQRYARMAVGALRP